MSVGIKRSHPLSQTDILQPAKKVATRRASFAGNKAKPKRTWSRKARPTTSLGAQIRREIANAAETKYVRAVLQQDQPLLGYVSPSAANAKFQVLLPELVQGTSNFTRLGNVVTPVKLRATYFYFFAAPTDGSSRVNLPGAYKIRQYITTSKSSKSQVSWTANQATETVTYIDNGDGTYAIPQPGTSQSPGFVYGYQQLAMPSNKDRFTDLPGCKVLDLVKNCGNFAQAPAFPAAATNLGTDPYTGVAANASRVEVIDIKCPAKFTYTSGINYPDNFAPLGAAAGSVLSEGANSYTALLGTVTGGVPANPIIKYTLTIELWYKDE